jgi:metal-responsive CopG/Arc/MetJ family transcriptional regulator
MKKTRTMIQLSQRQVDFLKEEMERDQIISRSELIRRIIDKYMESKTTTHPSLREDVYYR